jgi:thiol reductant ABC exporter CydC subunit
MRTKSSPWFLLAFLRGLLPAAALSVALSSAAVLLGVGLIGTSAYLISYAALQPSIAVLQVSIVGVRFFGIAKSVFRYLERLASHTVNFNMLTRLRGWIYRGISAGFPSTALTDSRAETLSRAIEDVETLEFFLIRVVNPPLAALLTGLVVSLVFYGFHPRLAATFAILFALSLVSSLALAYLLTRRASNGYLQRRSALHTELAGYLEGLPDLLVHQSVDRQAARVRAAEHAFSDAQMRFALASGLTNGLITLLSQLSMLIMLYGGILLVGGGQLDPKLLAVCALMTVAAFDAILPMPLAAQQLVLNEQAGERILQITGSQPDAAEVLPAQQERSADKLDLDLRAVSFSYPGAVRPSLDGLNLQLPAGTAAAMIGPSGAGKTTLSKLLLAYWSTYEGQICLGAADYRQTPASEIRARIGYSGQNPYFFNDTLENNLRLANRQADYSIMETALHDCQLGEWFDRLSEGWNTPLGERGLKLSEGERRRLDLARLLLRDCPIIILDEPFASLDALTESALTASLSARLRGKTTLWITHRLAGLEKMDQIIVLDHGRIVDRGSQAELLAHPGLFRSMWDKQRSILIEAP